MRGYSCLVALWKCRAGVTGALCAWSIALLLILSCRGARCVSVCVAVCLCRTRVGKSFLLNCLLMMGEGTREQYTKSYLELHKLEGVKFLCDLDERTGLFSGPGGADPCGLAGAAVGSGAGAGAAAAAGAAPGASAVHRVSSAFPGVFGGAGPGGPPPPTSPPQYVAHTIIQHHVCSPLPGVFDDKGRLVDGVRRDVEKADLLKAARGTGSSEGSVSTQALEAFLLPSSNKPGSGTYGHGRKVQDTLGGTKGSSNTCFLMPWIAIAPGTSLFD